MPLIIISGKPLTGKSTFVKRLVESLPKDKNIKIINDGLDSMDERTRVYSNESEEKKVRASLMAGVERYISKDTIVIMDSYNNIKSCRYQLYCISRAIPTNHCVVYVNALDSDIIERNKNLGCYDQNVLEGLMQRYEEPLSTNRWDSPLFNVYTSDNDDSAIDKEIQNIVDFIQQKSKLKIGAATYKIVSPSIKDSTSMDQVTNEIIQAVLKSQSDGLDLTCGKVKVLDYDTLLEFQSSNVKLPELKRLKRQFQTINRMVGANAGLGELFIDYLNQNVGQQIC